MLAIFPLEVFERECAGEIIPYTGCESVTCVPEYRTIFTMVFLFPQLRMTLLCVEMLR